MKVCKSCRYWGTPRALPPQASEKYAMCEHLVSTRTGPLRTICYEGYGTEELREIWGGVFIFTVATFSCSEWLSRRR